MSNRKKIAGQPLPYNTRAARTQVTAALAVLFLAVLLTGCAYKGQPAIHNRGMAPASVAVAYIYDSVTGDITDLGNAYRDRIELDFKNRGFDVKVRKEIVLLIDDMESFGKGDENKIWDKAEADILVTGSYRIKQAKWAWESDWITVTVKALRLSDASLADSWVIREPLKPGWVKAAAARRGNVFQKELAKVTSGAGDPPMIQARLDRTPACYPPGADARLHILTEPGVYLYIFNLAADQTVTLLYPNSVMPSQPLSDKTFVFPPPALSSALRLCLFPLEEGMSCSESFKVIASRHEMDFSFLPVPTNRVYSGAEGVLVRELVTRLKSETNYSEKTVTYWIGRDCSN